MMTKASYIWKAFAALAAAMVAAVALQLCLVTAAHAETISCLLYTSPSPRDS